MWLRGTRCADTGTAGASRGVRLHERLSAGAAGLCVVGGVHTLTVGGLQPECECMKSCKPHAPL